MAQSQIVPLLKWAGGKRWLAQRYASVFNKLSFERWVEPFSGGLALAFALQPKRVLASDINPHLINFYHQVQSGLNLKGPFERDRQFYLDIRAEFNHHIKLSKNHTQRQAELFWLLNKMGYNGLCRFNQSGFFNTPFGRYTQPLKTPCWELYKTIIAQWEFQNSSFEELILESGDFIFCDPPYDHSWQGYYHQSFSLSQQEDLARWVKKYPGKAMIMNHPTKKMQELYQDYGFELNYVEAPRRIGATPDSRHSRQELLVTHHFSWKDLNR